MRHQLPNTGQSAPTGQTQLQQQPFGATLIVSELPEGTSAAHIVDTFCHVSGFVQCRLRTARRRRHLIAFLEFRTPDDAASALMRINTGSITINGAVAHANFTYPAGSGSSGAAAAAAADFAGDVEPPTNAALQQQQPLLHHQLALPPAGQQAHPVVAGSAQPQHGASAHQFHRLYAPASTPMTASAASTATPGGGFGVRGGTANSVQPGAAAASFVHEPAHVQAAAASNAAPYAFASGFAASSASPSHYGTVPGAAAHPALATSHSTANTGPYSPPAASYAAYPQQPQSQPQLFPSQPMPAPQTSPALLGASGSSGNHNSNNAAYVQRLTPSQPQPQSQQQLLTVPSVPLPPGNPRNAQPQCTIYVVGIPPDATVRECSHIFRHYPGYVSITLTKKDSGSGSGGVGAGGGGGVKHDDAQHHGQQRTVAFVSFESRQQAEAAMAALTGYRFDELSPGLHLELARTVTGMTRSAPLGAASASLPLPTPTGTVSPNTVSAVGSAAAAAALAMPLGGASPANLGVVSSVGTSSTSASHSNSFAGAGAVGALAPRSPVGGTGVVGNMAAHPGSSAQVGSKQHAE